MSKDELDWNTVLHSEESVTMDSEIQLDTNDLKKMNDASEPPCDF